MFKLWALAVYPVISLFQRGSEIIVAWHSLKSVRYLDFVVELDKIRVLLKIR